MGIVVWATRDIFILCCFISFGICFCVFCNQDTKERIPITQVCRIIDLLEARFPEKCYLSKLKAFLSRLEIVSTGLTLQKKIGLRLTFCHIYGKENPFFISSHFEFYLINALVYGSVALKCKKKITF